MKILLIGGGGREHALGWKIAQSPLLDTLYLIPGNPGLAEHGEILDVKTDDHDAIIAACKEHEIDLVVVGPEAPLAAGLGDALTAANIACFGPSQKAAQLEASKTFAKEIMAACGAPTAGYERFTEADAAKSYVEKFAPPYVIKADGLAAGKGVTVAPDLQTAKAAIDDILGGGLGAAGAAIVIEEFMQGEEASFFALCDGTRALPLIAAQDHKRAYDGDTGPNTGGMGAYSPAPIFTDAIRTQTIEQVINPVLAEMADRGTPYIGVLYVGLMIEGGKARVVEFNARFGDPECQVLMRLMRSDIVPILMACAKGDVSGHKIDWADEACALVVMAAKGYPGGYEKGTPITGIDQADIMDGIKVFHAGTKIENQQVLANGGRVLNITAVGNDTKQAVARAYAAIDAIDWEDGFYRKDIAWRAL